MLKGFISILAGFSLMACGGTPQQKAVTDMPAWVLNPPAGCATGIQKFRGNLGMAKTAATAKGRTP